MKIKNISILLLLSCLFLNINAQNKEQYLNDFDKLITNRDCFKIYVLSEIVNSKSILYYDTIPFDKKRFNSITKRFPFKEKDVFNIDEFPCCNNKPTTEKHLKYKKSKKGNYEKGDYFIKFSSKTKIKDNFFQMVFIYKKINTLDYGYTIILRFKDDGIIDFASSQMGVLD